MDLVAKVVAPTEPGSYRLVWDLVEEGVAWFGREGGAREVAVQVRAPEARGEWVGVAPPPLYAGVAATVEVTLRNVGTVTWPAAGQAAVLLGYHWRDASGRVLLWDGERTGLETPVFPGESVAAELRVVPPGAAGRYLLEVDLVRDGLGWFGSTKRVAVDVAPSSLSASVAVREAPARVAIGQAIDVRVVVTNTGRAPWANAGPHPVRLSYHVTDAKAQVVLWDGPRTDIRREVKPGASVELRATVRAPHDAGTYKLTFDLVQEGVTWFTARGNRFADHHVEVLPLDHAAHFASLDAVKTMAAGLTYRVRAEIKNVGRVPWPRGGFLPVRAAYHWLDERGSVVRWDSPRTELPADVAPGEALSLTLDVEAPERPGSYALVVDLVQEGVAWFAEKGTIPGRASVRVAEPTFTAGWAMAGVPEQLKAGTIATARLAVRNDGLFAWVAGGEHPVRLAHHWRQEDGGLVVWDGFRTELARDLEPGDTIELDAWFFAPATPGRYVLEFDMVQEAVNWFADRGNQPLRRVVEVVP